MVDQTTVTNGRNAAPAEAMTRSMSDLVGDIASLAELQARLFAIDAKETMRRIVLPIVFAAAGMVLVLGSIPVLLLTLAALFTYAGMGAAMSLFLAFVVGMILGAIALGVAWYAIRRSLVSFQRSREELARNLHWIKEALRQNGRSAQAPPTSPVSPR